MYQTEQTQKVCAEADVMNEVLPTLFGFALAQVVNLVNLLRHWWVKPRLRIEEIGEGHVLLDHETNEYGRAWLREMVYGFVVRNRGRKIALGVQAFLVKVEARHREDEDLQQTSAYTGTLPWSGKSDRDPVVLARGAPVTVELARWLAGDDVVEPATGTEWECYRQAWDSAAQFRFTVAVTEEMGEQASHTIVIDNPSVRRCVR